MMDFCQDLNSFIQTHVDSFEKWDILVYYSRQPAARETTGTMVLMTGKSFITVQRAIDELACSGILAYEPGGSYPTYQLIPAIKPLLEQLREGLDERSSRFKLMMLAMESIRNRKQQLRQSL